MKYAIIDTDTNIACGIHLSSIENIKNTKNKEQVIVIDADDAELKLLGKTNLIIKIKHYIIIGKNQIYNQWNV